MISLTTALSWLNVLSTNTTAIRKENQPFVAQFFDVSQPKQLTNLLRNTLSFTDSPFEKAEIRLNAAAANCELQCYEEASVLIREALDFYKKQDPNIAEHRHYCATAQWAQGIIEKWLRNPTVYQSWFSAYQNFEKNAADPNLIRKLPFTKEWYAKTLESMEIDLISTAEYIYTWLDYFTPNHLSQAIHDWRIRITSLIICKDYQQVFKLLGKLAGIAENKQEAEEKEEIYIFCGLASYLVSNYDRALKYYQKGLSSLPSRQHHDAITRWLKGIALWEYNQQHLAVAEWEKSIEYFEEEKEIVNRNNNQEAHQWYKDKIPLLKKALERNVKEFITPATRLNPFKKPPHIIIPTIVQDT
ncbi:MAG: hypothetical protein HPY45_05970 [Anaerolineae bacterium]|nr:hypothetical protein [Anaerolineae bacterium]